MTFKAKFLRKHGVQKNAYNNTKIENILALEIVLCLVVMLLLEIPLSVKASPVIDNGGWSDTFIDANGIELSYNINISNGDVLLRGYRNDFEQEALGELPSGWTREFQNSGASGNNFKIQNHQYEPGKAVYMRINDDGSNYAWQKLWREFYEYYQYFEFELTFQDISVETERQGYAYIEFYDNTDTEHHEVRYYWDWAKSGIPSNSSTLTASDLGFITPVGSDLGIKYIIKKNISEDIDANPNVDLGTILGSMAKIKYGFYQDAGPGWNRWEHIYLDNLGIYNDNVGYLTSTKFSLMQGHSWLNLEMNKTEPKVTTYLNISILDGNTNLTISGFENIIGTNIDISSIDPIAHPKLRLYANLTGTGNATPILHDWSVSWIDITPPITPQGLAISNPWTGYSLILSWSPNPEPDLAFYVLYNSIDNITFYWLTNVSGNILSFTHYGLDIGITYYYKIAAADKVPNQSPFSDAVEGVPDQDMDNDGIGNIVDPDIDGDTVPNADDDFPLNENEWLDSDNDGIGNNADIEDDGDGYNDVDDAFPLNDSEWIDSDSDGIGNNADSDDDNDGYNDTLEITEGSDPINQGSVPKDNDKDHIPDLTDADDDNDGVLDVDDDLPFNPNEVIDTDGDGIGNVADTDDDNDGIPDTNDDFPLNASEWNDLDGDGTGDKSDSDKDGDGVPNEIDDFPIDGNEWLDNDNDLIGDNADSDDDGDGYPDINDIFPLDGNEYSDLDGDGIGDNSDTDIDGDGIANAQDIFPLNPREWEDYEGDGIGDNSDPDDDDDTHPDFYDAYPYDSSKWLEPKEPNELLIPFYIMLILLVILIVIGTILIAMMVKQGKGRTMPYRAQSSPPPQGEIEMQEPAQRRAKFEEEIPPPPPSP